MRVRGGDGGGVAGAGGQAGDRAAGHRSQGRACGATRVGGCGVGAHRSTCHGIPGDGCLANASARTGTCRCLGRVGEDAGGEGVEGVFFPFPIPSSCEADRGSEVKKKSKSVKIAVCKTSKKATKAGTVKLTCKLSAATRKARAKGSLRVSVKTTFTPTGGLPASKTKTVTLKRKR